MLLRVLSVVILSGTVAAAAACVDRGSSETKQNSKPAANESSAPAGTTAAAPLAAPEFALKLQSLLGQHSLLAADMMRARIRGDDDFAQAANSALGKNTDGITQIVQGAFGDQAANQFKSVWSPHVAAFFTYARGLADHDNAVLDQARNSLATFENGLAAFFSGASQGRLPLDKAKANVLMHVTQLTQQADAYAAKDYAKADQIYREAYAHTYGLGKALSTALLPPAQTVALQAPAWTLRSELDKLLGEHVVLVVDAERAGLRNSPDFATAAATVNANTQDIAAAIDSLFGPAAAKQLQALWADHVDQLMAYTTAVATKNQAARDAARAKLAQFEGKLATFLDAATNKKLDSATVAKALAMHDKMLIDHADAFAAKDYGKAHELEYTTYEHMYGLAGQMADAFGSTVMGKVPAGGAETGEGGMAGQMSHR
jgi:hypothetical protein